MTLFSIDLLHEILRYDPDSGKLFWRKRGVHLFRKTEGRAAENACATWNSRYADREAFLGSARGYVTGCVLNRPCIAHRVIWAMQTGEWPKDQIDHINGVRNDNRWVNLRAATRFENACNRPVPKHSRSGTKGVHWHARDKRWIARITANHKAYHLGTFTSLDDAKAAYAKASAELHGQFARTA
jgi:hypothetical protein